MKSLSAILSTASLDKNPQSRARGITLDLGFSAFLSDIPSQLKGTRTLGNPSVDSKYKHIQYTLVDCPGHASLIRTILGGAQIIDMLLFVIDCLKGIQTQTAECMVIGEITTDKAIFVLTRSIFFPRRIAAAAFSRSRRVSERRFRRRASRTLPSFLCASRITVDCCCGAGRRWKHRRCQYDQYRSKCSVMMAIRWTSWCQRSAAWSPFPTRSITVLIFPSPLQNPYTSCTTTVSRWREKDAS